MSSKKVVDLRGKRPGARVPLGQQILFPSGGSSRPQKRASPLRTRRRRALFIKLFVALLLVAGAAWGVSYVSYLPQVTIQEVDVVGAKDVSAQAVGDEVRSILDSEPRRFISKRNIFFYPRVEIEEAVASAFPRIKSVSVSRGSLTSTTLTLAVEERKAFALWCDLFDSCYDMDEGGYLFAKESASSTGMNTNFIFTGGLATSSTEPIGNSFVPAHLPGLVVLLRALGQAGFNPSGVHIASGKDFTVPLREGFLLKASFGQDATLLARNLELVLSSDALQGKAQELEYVDLRFGDRVYYKLKGGEEVEGE